MGGPALVKGDSDTLSSEILQLQKESDPELRSQGLLNAATREEARGNLAFASEAYAWLSEHGSVTGKLNAEKRLAILEGKGSFGQRAENLLRGFAKEASDPAMLLAMGLGGGVYKATKLATMSRLVGSSGYWGRGLGMKLAGSVAGYALEAPVFTAVGRWGRGEKLLGPGLKEELLSSYLVLGAMKTVGGVSRGISRELGGPRLEKFAGDVGLYGGILLGHKLETVAGLREWHSGGREWVDGLAMFFQLKASGRILNQLGGERYRGMERELEYRSEHLANWGALHRAANDAHYQSPIPRIGKVSEPSEQAANEGNYGLQEARIMPLAVGAEVFEVGERVKRHPAPRPEVFETGLRVFNMAEGGEPSGPGLLGRMGARIRIQAGEPHEVQAVLLPLIPETKLERPTTVSIPGGIRATGSPDITLNPVQWREVATFEMATRTVTNEEVETYTKDYQNYPLGLIWGDGERFHLIARGEAWDGKREGKARASLAGMFESFATHRSAGADALSSRIAQHPALVGLLEAVRKRHPRAPIFQQDEAQGRVTDWSRFGEEHQDYAIFREMLGDLGLEASFEGLCLFFKALQERGYLKGFSFESQRVVPELSKRELKTGFNGPKQAATEIDWYESVGIANAMGGRLPTEWEQEVAARGPAVRMDGNSNPENFENFYVGEVIPETALLNDHAAVREMIRRGMEVFGYRRYGTGSGGLNQQEAWYNREALPERADWGPVNGYELQGMVGGVWEWAGNNYDTKNSWRSLRGGSWIVGDPDYLRAAYRGFNHPVRRSLNFGARVVMAPQDSKAK